MVWITVALVLALCVFFMMCFLTLGKRTDQRKERLFRVDLQDLIQDPLKLSVGMPNITLRSSSHSNESKT